MNAEYTGKQIVRRRKELGMTQKQLAEQLSVTDKAVSKWERGLNFPDLGLMEHLAEALKTTPAELLGLETKGRDEIVSSMTALSTAQLEEAGNHLKWAGWSFLLFALLLALGCIFYKNDLPFQLRMTLTWAPGIFGLWLLFRCGQIKKFDIAEYLLLYGAAFPVLMYLGIQFLTGHSPQPVFGAVLIVLAAAFVQLLFYRIMVPGAAKAIPLLLCTGYAVRQLPGQMPLDWDSFLFALPALVCLSVWIIFFGADLVKKKIPAPSWKKWLAGILGVILVLLFCFYHPLIRTYIGLRQTHLTAFAEDMLEAEAVSGRYGFWKVRADADAGMVEFRTGGSGLVPSSTYEGFYYSREDVHLPFQGNTDLTMEPREGYAIWNDGYGNWGKSWRIFENWYWYQAYF